MNSITPNKRDVLVSIHPLYAKKILEGEKTVELRRQFPQVASIGATILIYSTRPVQAVVGYARIKNVLKLPIRQIWEDHGEAACISKTDFHSYFVGCKFGYAIVLEAVSALIREFPADELRDKFGFVAPQSFRYIQADYIDLLKDEQSQTSRRHKRNNRA